MERVNNLVVALTIVLLIISLFGTFTLIGKINFVQPAHSPTNVQTGKVGFQITEPGTISLTGHVGLEVLPEE